ncbi:ABC-type phosphate transport system periplasmic component-like protein [Acetivibrio thermocellus ATCC 27405]|uniref:ABC-type phosphate transport system periplasmic component-like protein n=1 Tax=Acetivibrio thermocellus (strain ATCC 27405 / DSM 1237 / JCM 9322 / NBRC 103400 / NCIMB 10682 / NRRL B-4536 / VPI 7372) TaxID=203119 RepID=A3DFV2_ACET2|nr:substrate-binding domain-containing protein [Acetivibrio thermocellus]ABN52831.1 ABC-type phosphate transport system periplasmic component-like protein [Acetivibrio thermocellus ATCC 27405]
MKKMKRIVLTVTILALFITGCATENNNEIVVVSREEGSGTRGAFIELFGIEEKDSNGNKVDKTTDEATVVNSTSVVMTTVAGNKNSIGYISLGSLNDTVKAVKVDGVEPTVENIKNNTYKVFRPFIIATKENPGELTQDFISFILSSDGQKVVEENSYIAASEKGPYSSTKPSGKIVIAGSSSVTPLMEKLKEAYLKVNTNAEIEIQASDSTTGMKLAMEGTCDIGMASRELKESELKKLKPTVIAMDGLVVIVNKENPVSNLTSDQIKGIFKGEITSWNEVAK